MGVHEYRGDLKKGEEDWKRSVSRPALVVLPIKQDAALSKKNKKGVTNKY
jgi:hypothetical protein